jgi:hypothetical protein
VKVTPPLPDPIDSTMRAAGFTVVIGRGSILARGQAEVIVCMGLYNLLMRPLVGPDTVRVRADKADSALAAIGRRYGAVLASRTRLGVNTSDHRC